MSDNHNRPTKHEHNQATCMFLGCKEKMVDRVLTNSVAATKHLVDRELEVEKTSNWPDWPNRTKNVRTGV